nr:YciI family protein [Nevskia soli]
MSNSDLAVRRYSEGGQLARLKTILGDDMPQYLVAIHHPDNYDPSAEDESMVRDIDALNEEMAAAGARFFAGGLQSAPHAKSLRKQPGGQVVITDGPYLETKEHIGGFWILDAANMDEAVKWGRKAAAACRASVEVREFLAMPRE